MLKFGGNQSPNSLMLLLHWIVGHRHKYATVNPINYKNVGISKCSKKMSIFDNNWPKTNLLTRALQKGHYFSETIFCRVFWNMRGLYLPKLAKKSSSCVVDLTKTAKILLQKVSKN